MYSTTSISLSTVLDVKPVTWEPASYSGKNCVTIQLGAYSDEYNEIKDFVLVQGINDTIEKIERVQHPFAYGRFLIRKEQLEKRHGDHTVNTIRKLYYVSRNEVNEALQYNMDTRRTSSISTYKSFNLANYCVIITQQLSSHYFNKSRDSEEYPQYVVYFQ